MPKPLNMLESNNIQSPIERKTLKDFVPLIFAFFGGLVGLSLYQNLRLYLSGVLDSFLNKSFALLVLHHTGFVALTALVLAFLFNFLENRKSGYGLKVVRILLLILLGIEGLLIAYYVQNYEILGVGIYGISNAENVRFFLVPIVFMLFATALIFHYLHKLTASFYNVISSMYPFTLIVFSVFLATLRADKKPVNENKTQHLISSVAMNLFDYNSYEGEKEFPLLTAYKPEEGLTAHFNLKHKKPNLVVIIVDGLGADFVGPQAAYKGFTPGLDALAKKSLYWKNFVSNTGTSFAALPTVIGSLPFGETGFTNIESFTHRNTLYSILKTNGYRTSFNYGGNSALNHFDRFLDEEKVDYILDRNGFGAESQLQKEDAAGISLGYPDAQLFKQWNKQALTTNEPRIDVFLTLSSKNPFQIPNKTKLEGQVAAMAAKLPVSKRSKRLIANTPEVFASIIYVDAAISQFIKDYEQRPEFENTIFMITGSHNLTDLPQTDQLGRFRVPLIMYSPLIKAPKTFKTLASHADIAPSIIGLLDSKYNLNVPTEVAWLGNTLVSAQPFSSSKEIPLFRAQNNIQDFIKGNHYFSDGTSYQITENFDLLETDDDGMQEQLKTSFSHFKSVNEYVTTHNKIMPEATALTATTKTDFTKTEMIWIESVFNDDDVDKAYFTARELAFDNDWKRATLLCNYILNTTPRHADTEILLGRVHAWQKDYATAETVLKEAIRKYPKYADGYAALLDTYFWASTPRKALAVFEAIERNQLHNSFLNEKVKRAKYHISKGAVKQSLEKAPQKLVRIEFE